MAIEGFSRLASEFGQVAYETGRPYEFLFLGSANDPSAVPCFAQYLAVWLDAMPAFSPIRFYTHGWLLSLSQQQQELSAVSAVLARRANSIEMINVSIDHYSALARSDITQYELNVAKNIRQLVATVGRSKLRLHIMYPIERHQAPESVLLATWAGCRISADEVLTTLDKHTDPAEHGCATLTASVVRIGRAAGLTVAETIAQSRDAGLPMAAGRAIRLFRNMPNSARNEGLAWYRRKALPRLRETHGLQVFPDGSVQVIDYDGYQRGPWLDKGARIVRYLEALR